MELEMMLTVRVRVSIEIDDDGPSVERCEVIECIPAAPGALEIMARAEAATPRRMH